MNAIKKSRLNVATGFIQLCWSRETILNFGGAAPMSTARIHILLTFSFDFTSCACLDKIREIMIHDIR